MIRTPLSYRWPRAQQIARAGKVFGSEHGGFQVQGTRPEPYVVKIEFDAGRLLAKGNCTCPDFVKMAAERERNPTSKGLPLLRDILVCKHILAAAIQAQKPKADAGFGYEVAVQYKGGRVMRLFNVSRQWLANGVRYFRSEFHGLAIGTVEANIAGVTWKPSEDFEESM